MRLLGLFAHPDDQGLLCGGTIARYAEGGADVISVLAAPGDGLNRSGFRSAARRLGVRDVVLLDYQPGELIDDGELDRVCGDLLRSLRPDVVITFGPDGLNRDPDHLVLHTSAARAFFGLLAAEGSVGAQPKLYYGIWPRRHLQRALGALRTQGVTSAFLAEVDRWGAPDSLVTTIIDVEAQLNRKVAAILDQGLPAPGLRELANDQLADLWGSEFFRRAHPHPWVTGVIERDLFRGLHAPAHAASSLAQAS